MPNNSKEVTAAECSQLREIIPSFVAPGVINRDEYYQIMFALKSCADRMEKEGRISDV
jgi:hypothetical protein